MLLKRYLHIKHDSTRRGQGHPHVSIKFLTDIIDFLMRINIIFFIMSGP